MPDDSPSMLPAPGRRTFLAAAAALPVAACATPEPSGAVLAPRRRRPSAPNANPQVIVARQALDGAGARVRRLFPQTPGQHHDPFVLLDDFGVASPAGFPEHPHRGFEAFTYMLDGAFHHRDTMGNDSVVETGGTQRFTSGRGARHSEMPAAPQVNRGLQLWVNLPPELKRMEPEYAAVAGEDIPEEGQGDVVVRTVVGPGSPSRLRTAVRYLDVAARSSNARFETEVPGGASGLVYVVDGAVKVGDRVLSSGEAALPVAGELVTKSEGPARWVVLTGERHGQPIRHRGPYVD